MGQNRGKQFEDIVKQGFEQVPNTVVFRLHDQMTGYMGSKNPCDFIVYHNKHLYAIECKSVHGNRFPFTNITDYQLQQLRKIAETEGCCAGILCWWVDKDITKFIPIGAITEYMVRGKKSLRFDDTVSINEYYEIVVSGHKKRVFFDYDFNKFFSEVEND